MTQPVSDKARTVLRDIGLTDYETRAYLHLLQMGVTTASRISTVSNIPYSKIYEVLNLLERKGWIETQTGRPRLYYPKSPIEALEATRLKLEDTIKNWRKSVLEELQPRYDKREIREKPDVWILRGEYDAIAKLKDLLRNVQNELMVAIPILKKPLLNALLPLFMNFQGINVKIQILASKEQWEKLDVLVSIGEVRIRENMFGGGIISDSREALLLLGEKESPLIIWSDHLGLVMFARDYFQHLWNSAEKI